MRIIAFAIFLAAVLALLYPLKIFIPGMAWNTLPPSAWKALPRFVCDARALPLRTFEAGGSEAVRFFFWGFLTRHRRGWAYERAPYPIGVMVVADTARLDFPPGRDLAVFLYRGPTGGDIQLVRRLAPGEGARLADEALAAVSAAR